MSPIVAPVVLLLTLASISRPLQRPSASLNLNSKTGLSSLVMGKLGERHEADALIGILLEYRNLVAGLAAERLSRNELNAAVEIHRTSARPADSSETKVTPLPVAQEESAISAVSPTRPWRQVAGVAAL